MDVYCDEQTLTHLIVIDSVELFSAVLHHRGVIQILKNSIATASPRKPFCGATNC